MRTIIAIANDIVLKRQELEALENEMQEATNSTPKDEVYVDDTLAPSLGTRIHDAEAAGELTAEEVRALRLKD